MGGDVMTYRERRALILAGGLTILALWLGGPARAGIDNPTPRHAATIAEVCAHPRVYARLGVVVMPEACE
jgi:hypothetical protein